MRIKNISYIPPTLNVERNKNGNVIIINTPKNLNGILTTNDKKIKGHNHKLEPDEMNFRSVDDLLKYLDGDDNNKKSYQSIYRAKKVIFDLINSNDWDYFITMTIDPKKAKALNINPKDVKQVMKYIKKFINNQNRKYTNNIKSLIIPEYQKNGNVHIHGVISGIDKNDIKIALNNKKYMKDENDNTIYDNVGNPIKNEYYKKPLIRNGNQVYNYKPYKLGFTEFEEIRYKERVGSYCTKYINKELEKRCDEFGAHLYYCSKGLERPKKVYSKELKEYRKLDHETIKKVFPNAYIVDCEYSQKIYLGKYENENILYNELETLFNTMLQDNDNKINDSMVAAQLDVIKDNGMKGLTIGNKVYYYNDLTGEFIVKDKRGKVLNDDVQTSIYEFMYG